jgi:hypothetical protein
LSFADFEARAEAFDREVDRTPFVDRFCSASAWILPAREAFAPAAQPMVLELESGWLPLMVQPGHYGLTALPMEAMWGMGCPLVGADPQALVDELFEVLRRAPLPWQALYLTGIDPEGPVLSMLEQSFGEHHRLGRGAVTRRCLASLDGGFDGFLSRRSAGFRAKLRQAFRQAQRESVSWEHHGAVTPAQVDALFERVVGVERSSWKGLRRIGIQDGAMHAFYRRQCALLAAQGSLRVGFVTRGGDDLAYVLGGVRGRGFRGLQISYDAAEAELQPGNLGQAWMLSELCEEGIESYDMGMDMAYKHRWAEGRRDTILFAVLRRD